MIGYRALADALRVAVPDLKEAGTARNLGAVRESAIGFPSAFVVPLSQTAGPNRYAECDLIDQNVTERFGVILAVRDIHTTAGGDALSEAEIIQPAVVQALGRFRPPGAESTCVHRQGRLLSGVDAAGRLFWQDDFQVQFSRRITGE